MGRLNNGGEDQKRFLKHSSHDHHLELTSVTIQSDRATCFGCDSVILPGTPHLSCRTCGFYLHRDCYDFPKRIRHPAHDHVLVLDTAAAASFQCKACDSDGRGFAYRCTTCHQDFHCVCVAKPLLVTDPSVHEHELTLCFKPPYEGETGFRCDLCRREGYGWLYCCQACHFDVHIDYAKCKVAVILGTTRAVGNGAPPYQTQTRNIQDVVPGNFPVMTTTRAPINNTSLPPVNHPQLGPNGSFPPVNHPQLGPNGSFGYVNSQGVGAPNPGQVYGNNNFVYLQPPQGNNQLIYLQPNRGPPLNVLQPNTGFGYGAPMMTNGYHPGGTKDMFLGGIASGLGEGMGQGFVGMGMDALGLGGSSSMGSDLDGGESDFAGSYAGEWASSII